MNFDVVIVTHRSASHLPAVLEALPTNATVFVVDNASPDNSAQVAASFGATVVRGSVNAGFASGCNRGARLGSAKAILFLNPDAVLDAESLEHLMGALADDPQIGVASPRLVYPDGSPQRVQWPFPSARGAWREAAGLAHHDGETPGGFVVGACLLVRREAFEAVGGFDERFWLYGEEADLCRRIDDLGWKIRRISTAVATHVGGASGESHGVGSDLILEHFIRGGEHFVDKHAGPRALVSYRAANLTGSAIRAGAAMGGSQSEHRRRFVRQARTLATTPTRVALDSPATASPGAGLVVCSLEAWDEVWRRNQFFVRELLAADPDLRVLFVEPAFDLLHERRRGSGRRHAPGLRPVEGEGRIVRFEPVKWLPRKVGAFADRWRDDQVLDAVRQVGFVQPRLWVNDPSYATLADAVGWPAVYDITDDWTSAGDPQTRAVARQGERRLFARCETVTVCSPGLAASKRSERADLVLVPNGVDAEALQAHRSRPDDLPSGATAVYVGSLHTDRLDVDLTIALAETLSDVSVVLVGPDALDDVSRRRLDHAGVLRLGARPVGEVPGYLQHASVVIVPHVVSPFTESLDPIKAYECLAVGAPTVATPVAGFRGLGEPIRVADRDDFVDVVRSVVDEAPDLAPQAVPSWAERAVAFAAAFPRASTDAGTLDAPLADAGPARGVGPRQGAARVRSGERHLVVNARFRQRPLTGVERYASELDARLPQDVRRLGPPARLAHPPMGHMWEQTKLPFELQRDDVLWSPCNTGPALLGRQIVTIHDLSPTEHPEWFSPNYGRWLDMLSRSFVRHALHLVTVSEFTKERLCERLGAQPDRISVVPNGVSPTFFDHREPLSAADRIQLGLDDRPYLLSVATFEPRKNLKALIDAFRLVEATHPDLTLVIAGSSGRSEIFADGDVDSGLDSDSVRLIGYVPETMLPSLYAGAEALVYVPHYEGFGLPPLEAAATGTSAILSDIPALHETGLPATWVDPGDVEGIAAGIVDTIDGGRIDSAELTTCASSFTWDGSFAKLLDVFAGQQIHVGPAL